MMQLGALETIGHPVLANALQTVVDGEWNQDYANDTLKKLMANSPDDLHCQAFFEVVGGNGIISPAEFNQYEQDMLRHYTTGNRMAECQELGMTNGTAGTFYFLGWLHQKLHMPAVERRQYGILVACAVAFGLVVLLVTMGG